MILTRTIARKLFAPVIRTGASFARDDRGVTAIEFGILALPFFTLIFAIIETAMMFFATQVIDSALEDASRMVRTGQAQAANYSLADFRNSICGYTFNLFDCSKIKIDVKVISTFASATPIVVPQTCTAATCTWTTPDTYQPGIGRQIIQVSAYYRWPLLVVLPYFNLKNQPDNYRLLAAVRVFRNEPFS